MSAAAACLESVHAAIGEWLHVPPEDRELIDICLAVVKSNELPGDPLWLMVIDASGGGKTELLRALRLRPEVFFLSQLTPKTLVSGYRDPDAKRAADPSLLPQLNGKVLIIKDLSPILEMGARERKAVFATLRDAYDGFVDAGFGSIGRVGYQSRFSALVASTPTVERFGSLQQELGERFVKVRVRTPDTRAKTARALANTSRDGDAREAIQRAIGEFLDALPPLRACAVPADWQTRIAALADFTARVRSHVPRDSRHAVTAMPQPEYGTRLAKELSKLLVALAAVRGHPAPTEADYATVARVAEDCAPIERNWALNAFRAAHCPLSAAQVGADSGLGGGSVTHYALQDLCLLGLLEQVGEAEYRPKSDWLEAA